MPRVRFSTSPAAAVSSGDIPRELSCGDARAPWNSNGFDERLGSKSKIRRCQTEKSLLCGSNHAYNAPSLSARYASRAKEIYEFPTLTTMKLRIGVVGLGNDWDTRYKPAFRSLADRFEVRAICEPVALRADKAIHDFSACGVDGFRALARRPDIDAIFVLSRGWYGELPVLAACDAGKSIYCTEGLDEDLGRATSLKRKLETAGVSFLAEFPRRYAPATARLKELIATQLGRPKLLFCHARLSANQRTKLNGHAVSPPRSPMSHLIELVDWCRYVVGEDPTTVMGVEHEPSLGFHGDYQMMSLEFRDPEDADKVTTAQVSCGQYMPADWPEAVTFRPPPAFQVACEHGIAFVDLPSTIIWFDKAGRHMESLDSERPVGELMLLQFYRCVTSLLHNPTGLEDAYRALTIVLAGQESYRRGVRMKIET